MSENHTEDIRSLWNEIAKKILLNKKIVEVRYLTEEESESIGWNSCSVFIVLDDGTQIVACRDDEQNDAGVLGYVIPKTDKTDEEFGVLPVI